MAFTPEKPERPQDLICYCDPDENQTIGFFYDSEDGLFYREKNEWVSILEEDFNDLDLDGISIYVKPSFTSVYDKAEKQNEIITIDTVYEYESIPKDLEQE